MAQPSRRPFGRTLAGEPVELLGLDNGVLRCEILTFGATLRVLEAPDRAGNRVDVVLGYDDLESYLRRDGYLGAAVGRCANRIANGRFTLNGKEYVLAVNNGPNHLHGGRVGFSHRAWQVEELEGDRAVLTLFSPDGEEGYPGNLNVRATYRLDGPALELKYEARSDQDTPCNLTNHSYFNLAGQGSGPVLDQEIQIFAQSYTPTDDVSIPLGRVEPVEGTPMDLRRPTPIGARIDDDFSQLHQAGGYDHNYVVDGPAGTLRPAAWARSGSTGIIMETRTTLPGVQLYTANGLGERPGKGGAAYGPRHAFCLETQFFPDSPNQPQFPSCILKAGSGYEQVTRYRFSTDGG
ncbi:MAG TPA: galactose mutarotase [Candidatus Enterenecus stercoripullorum]|nr:galactose mutarotase [Candidatus Enterenecus stercoripullorum]